VNVVAAAPVAGRMCPADYVYSPSVFDRPPEIVSDAIYVVGGLYGNLAALDTIERLAAAEATRPAIVFNGDFHWFDAEPDWFSEIEERVAPHPALRGNVETEIARPGDIGAGCGCAYPADVEEGVVQRSNDILRELRGCAPAAAKARLSRLPMHLVAQVGGLRIGIVHGDAASLAGWRFSGAKLDDTAMRGWFAEIRASSRTDAFASTHTCLALLRDLVLPSGRLTIINNGAAGMANFSASMFGVVSRIATTRSPHRTLYGLHRDGVYFDAVAVHFRHDQFLGRFLNRWQVNSPAHRSYFQRISAGADYPMTSAIA
jgi:hypothetical protein